MIPLSNLTYSLQRNSDRPFSDSVDVQVSANDRMSRLHLQLQRPSEISFRRTKSCAAASCKEGNGFWESRRAESYVVKSSKFAITDRVNFNIALLVTVPATGGLGDQPQNIRCLTVEAENYRKRGSTWRAR